MTLQKQKTKRRIESLQAEIAYRGVHLKMKDNNNGNKNNNRITNDNNPT
jgi:hypothetical protein